jgi:hypothetical protein
MRYFTPELYLRGNSANEEEVRGIEEDWERALRAYNRRWKKIRPLFPKGVQRFEEEGVCLHDAHLLSMTLHGKNLVLVLQMEPPSRKMVLLTFALTGEPDINTKALPDAPESGPVAWLYEEWALDRHGHWWFEVLLSNGWLVKLPFRDFHYQIGDQLLQTTDGEAAPGPAATVARRT